MKRSARLAIWIAIILVVCALAFLIQGFLPRDHYAKGRLATCEAIISSLEQALAMYEMDHGNYPPSLALLSESQGKRGHIYFEFKPNQKDGVRRILDLWGHPLVYRIRPEEKGRHQVLLYSTGPNGIDEKCKGDDVSNED